MADKKISDFTATTSLAASDLFEIETSGGNSRKITAANVMASMQWALVGGGSGHAATGTWVQSTDGSAANVDFTGLNSSHLLILFDAVTKSVSGELAIQVSVDNGSSFYAGTDCIIFDTTGSPAGTNLYGLHTTNATAARSAWGEIYCANLNGVPKPIMRNTRGQAALFKASLSPINAIRCLANNGGNLTGGSIYVFGR